MGILKSAMNFFRINDIEAIEHDHTEEGIGKVVYFADPKAGYTTRIITEDMTAKEVIDIVRDAREQDYPDESL